MGKQNAISVAITILLIPIYLAILAQQSLLFGANSIFAIGVFIVYAVVIVFGYFSNLILGLGSIATGRKGAAKVTATGQMLMCLANLIWAVYGIYTSRKEYGHGTRNTLIVFGIIFLILLVMALSRKRFLKESAGDEVFVGNPRVARRIFLIEVVYPIVIAILSVSAMKLLEKYPIIGKILGIASVLLFIPFLVLLVGGILALASKFDTGDSAPDIPSRPATGPKQAPRTVDNSKAVENFDSTYEREYRRITGMDPGTYQILSEGPEKQAVDKMRAKMRNEAKKKGYIGKSKYFK